MCKKIGKQAYKDVSGESTNTTRSEERIMPQHQHQPQPREIQTNGPAILVNANDLKTEGDRILTELDSRLTGKFAQLNQAFEDSVAAGVRDATRRRGKTMEELLTLPPGATAAERLDAIESEARKAVDAVRAAATPEDVLPPVTYRLTGKQIAGVIVSSLLAGAGAFAGGSVLWRRRQDRMAAKAAIQLEASSSPAAVSSPTPG
jgi:hypothetical protein